MMKLVKKCMIIVLAVCVILGGTMVSYADVVQSDRWEGAGDTWKVRTQDNTGYLTNSWFQDNDASWYMLGADGTMSSGIIFDESTGKSYLLNTEHDGTYGKMLTQDGAHNVNGVTVYLTFDQNHNGTYGAILTGLSEARSTGVKETSLTSIPSDSASSTTSSTTQPNHTSETPSQNNNQQNTDNTQQPANNGGSIWDTPGVSFSTGYSTTNEGHFSGGLK